MICTVQRGDRLCGGGGTSDHNNQLDSACSDLPSERGGGLGRCGLVAGVKRHAWHGEGLPPVNRQCQRSGSATRDRGDEPSRAVPAAAAIRLRVRAAAVQPARVPRLNGSAAASTVRTTGRVRGKRGLLATIDAQRRVPIMSIRSPPSASRARSTVNMHADLIRTSLRDSCLGLGVAPGVHEAWHKNAEKALVPCFALCSAAGLRGPWGVSPAGPRAGSLRPAREKTSRNEA